MAHVIASFIVPNPFLATASTRHSRKFIPSCVPLIRRSRTAATITMLRVQKKRRPEDWDEKKSSLSGRFLPMDPRDEAVLDVLENNARGPLIDAVPPSESDRDDSGLSTSGSERKWSKRSEAARKRWSDPEYRAKMLAKRAEKRRRDREQQEQDKRLEIGCMDSITLSDESKAQAINAYAISNKLRSEKITAFHRNRKAWMEERLQESPQNLTDDEYVGKKLELKQKRRLTALKRAEIRRTNKMLRERKSTQEGNSELDSKEIDDDKKKRNRGTLD